MNIAYKHLDAKLRIADLTLGQWLTVFAGVGIAVVWGLYVSPFGSTATMVSAIYVGALPAGAAFIATMSELDVWLLIRSAIRWRRLDARFVSGPGDSAQGYVVHEDNAETVQQSTGQRAALDLALLWEQQ